MSAYVNEYTVLNALKVILDADSTLSDLLAVKDSNSKVVLGIERPDLCNAPVVHLSFLTRNINVETKLNFLLLRVSWFTSAYPSGIEDIEGLAAIGERIYELLDDQLPTISGYNVHIFCAESGESSAKDMLQPEGRPEHFQSLTFRMSIIRII